MSWELDWSFYLERAAFQGGFIERMILDFKRVFRKVVGPAKLNLDEFRTVVVSAEGMLNSRPLTYVYDSPDEGEPLTPSKLLLGYNLTDLPPMDKRRMEDIPQLSLVQRYQVLESIKNSLWNRWTKEYLTSLSEPHFRQDQGSDDTPAPYVGEVVLLRNEQKPRRHWRLARVVEAKKSKRDGKVRTCIIKTMNASNKKLGDWKSTELKRSPSFLVPLEVN